jgi:hypothetical protein
VAVWTGAGTRSIGCSTPGNGVVPTTTTWMSSGCSSGAGACAWTRTAKNTTNATPIGHERTRLGTILG